MKATALLVVAGLVGVADAQVMTYEWSISDTGNDDGLIEPGESALLTLSAAMDPDQSSNDGGFAGTIYDILGVTNWDTGNIDSYQNLFDPFGYDWYIGDDNNITGIESFQLPLFFNPFFNASNPIDIFKITWTPLDYTPRTVEVSDANHQNNDVYTDIYGSTLSYDPVSMGGSFRIVPAPTPLALLGLGGLIANRRRR